MLVLVVINILSTSLKKEQGIQKPFKMFGENGKSQFGYQKEKTFDMSTLKILIQSQGRNSIHPKAYSGCLTAYYELLRNQNQKKRDLGTFKSECSDLPFYYGECSNLIYEIVYLEEEDVFFLNLMMLAEFQLVIHLNYAKQITMLFRQTILSPTGGVFEDLQV
jgi:hypothetical protein